MTRNVISGHARGLDQRITARCKRETHTPACLFNYQHQPLEKLSHEDKALLRMMRAAILQAVVDLASHSKKPEAIRAKREAAVWVESSGFDDWCVDAGFEPSYIRRKIKDAAKRGFAWRLPAGQGWRVQKRLEESKS